MSRESPRLPLSPSVLISPQGCSCHCPSILQACFHLHGNCESRPNTLEPGAMALQGPAPCIMRGQANYGHLNCASYRHEGSHNYQAWYPATFETKSTIMSSIQGLPDTQQHRGRNWARRKETILNKGQFEVCESRHEWHSCMSDQLSHGDCLFAHSVAGDCCYKESD